MRVAADPVTVMPTSRRAAAAAAAALIVLTLTMVAAWLAGAQELALTLRAGVWALAAWFGIRSLLLWREMSRQRRRATPVWPEPDEVRARRDGLSTFHKRWWEKDR